MFAPKFPTSAMRPCCCETNCVSRLCACCRCPVVIWFAVAGGTGKTVNLRDGSPGAFPAREEGAEDGDGLRATVGEATPLPLLGVCCTAFVAPFVGLLIVSVLGAVCTGGAAASVSNKEKPLDVRPKRSADGGKNATPASSAAKTRPTGWFANVPVLLSPVNDGPAAPGRTASLFRLCPCAAPLP